MVSLQPPPEKTEMDKEETEYMLRWSEHSAQVMATFTQVGQQNVIYERRVSKVRIMLQLWELGQLTDVTLATEERVFQVSCDWWRELSCSPLIGPGPPRPAGRLQPLLQTALRHHPQPGQCSF